ncbi:hypothetical protein PRABACTJOHN_01511 [Parabacteroides johnsonii DSM 18315]|uniref:Uncharacterized protein n=1 Tax=Parabacteroides johnsonii DSM 18315 TaxID=537006 RepID=B7B908_9BACT|nr:hypothetical protein PRABACTJOHN_01511 [Parabacteroides johnsonii DSM 18315]
MRRIEELSKSAFHNCGDNFYISCSTIFFSFILSQSMKLKFLPHETKVSPDETKVST